MSPGLKNFYQAKEGYLQSQIGNPEGEDKPNKSYYDPRKWVRPAAWADSVQLSIGLCSVNQDNFIKVKGCESNACQRPRALQCIDKDIEI